MGEVVIPETFPEQKCEPTEVAQTAIEQPPTPKVILEDKPEPTGRVVAAQPRNWGDNASKWVTWVSVGVIAVGALSVAVGDTRKAVYNYLSGANAMDENELNERVIEANPQGKLRQPMAVEQMVAQAYRESPEKGAAALDALKKRSASLMAAGSIAIGNGNLAVAAQNINNAMRWMPDGNEVHVVANGAGGFKVTTTDWGTTLKNPHQVQNFQLTADQMNQFIHGPQGNWDSLLIRNIGQVFSRLERIGVRSDERKGVPEEERWREPAQTQLSPPPGPWHTPGLSASVTLQSKGGTFVVPVLINNTITLDFVVDSGAADVSVPNDVVSTLVRTGTIDSTDFLGRQLYTLADGTTIPSTTFRIRSLRVGDIIVHNIKGSVAPVKGSLLLGQSFLSHFKSWSVDNTRHTLILKP